VRSFEKLHQGALAGVFGQLPGDKINLLSSVIPLFAAWIIEECFGMDQLASYYEPIADTIQGDPVTRIEEIETFDRFDRVIGISGQRFNIVVLYISIRMERKNTAGQRWLVANVPELIFNELHRY
jgi:hypothetical protein